MICIINKTNNLLKTRIMSLKRFFLGFLFIILSSTLTTSCTSTDVDEEINQQELIEMDTYGVDKPEIRRQGDND